MRLSLRTVLISFFAFLLVSTGQLFAQEITRTAFPDMVVTIDTGTFTIKNLHLVKDVMITLEGEVTNNTSKSWNYLELKFTAIDANGKAIAAERSSEGLAYIRDLSPGKTQTFDHVYFFSLSELAEVAKLSVEFAHGTFPVEYSFEMVKPVASHTLSYSDKLISITFVIKSDQIVFELENQTDSPISIEWADVSFIDISKESHKVMHQGVKYIDRDEAQPSTTVPPTAKVTDTIIPNNRVFYSEAIKDWTVLPSFPPGPLAYTFKGKTFGIFMPLKINGIVKNYLFSFFINDIKG